MLETKSWEKCTWGREVNQSSLGRIDWEYLSQKSDQIPAQHSSKHWYGIYGLASRTIKASQANCNTLSWGQRAVKLSSFLLLPLECFALMQSSSLNTLKANTGSDVLTVKVVIETLYTAKEGLSLCGEKICLNLPWYSDPVKIIVRHRNYSSFAVLCNIFVGVNWYSYFFILLTSHFIRLFA